MFLVSSHKSLLSHWTSQQTSVFIVQRWNAKIYLKNFNNSFTPASHSWPKQFFKYVISLIHCSFLQVHWHYSFHFLGYYFFHFFWTLFLPLSWTLCLPPFFFFFFSLGIALYIYSPSLIRGSSPHRLNWVDFFRTRLPGWASTWSLQYLCLCTQGSTSGPGPGCYL